MHRVYTSPTPPFDRQRKHLSLARDDSRSYRKGNDHETELPSSTQKLRTLRPLVHYIYSAEHSEASIGIAMNSEKE